MTIAIDLSRTVAVMLHEHGEIIENYRDFNGCRFLVLVWRKCIRRKQSQTKSEYKVKTSNQSINNKINENKMGAQALTLQNNNQALQNHEVIVAEFVDVLRPKRFAAVGGSPVQLSREKFFAVPDDISKR